MSYKYTYDYEEKAYEAPKLKTDRSALKFILLNTLTLGIYSIIFFIPLAFDLDKVAPKTDRSKTLNYLFAWILALFTFNIVIDIWHYMISSRVSEALSVRGIDYEFGTQDFWGWFILGSLILIGPYVYVYRLCRAMNLLCESYNEDPTV